MDRSAGERVRDLIAAPAAPNVSVLMVDDHPGPLLVMEAILADLDLNLLKANSAEEALKYLLDHDVAVILLDVKMPRIDGFELASLIRSRDKTRYTPIIFVTGASTLASDVSRGYSLGAVDYLFKPFAPEILKTKVTVFVELFKRFSQSVRPVAGSRPAAPSTPDVEQFAQTVSEHLQEPMRVIAEGARQLQQRLGPRLDPEAVRQIELIAEAAIRLQRIVDGLVSQPESPVGLPRS